MDNNKHTFTNVGRIIISLTIFWFVYSTEEIRESLPLNLIHLIFSLLWFIIIYFEVINEEKIKWSGFIPLSIDCFMLFLLINHSGGIFSFLSIGFLISTALSSLILDTIFGRFAAILSFFFYSLSGILIKFEVINNYNVFTKQKSLYSFPIFTMACFVMGVGLFILNYVINNSIRKNHKLQLEAETSRLRAEDALLEFHSEKSQNDRLQEMSNEIHKKINFSDMLFSFEKILWESYNLGDFYFFIFDKSKNILSHYSMSSHLYGKIKIEDLKSISIHDTNSVHANIFNKKKSFFIPRLKKSLSTGDEENHMREYLGMKSLFTIPLIADDTCFAIFSISDIKNKFARKPNSQSVSKLTLKKRREIEQLVSLISIAFFQSLQKKQLEDTQKALSRAERSASLNSLVSHLAHEVNNPLNFISTGEMITRESVQEAKSFILGAIPDSPDSLPFVEKIKALFNEIEIGLQQSSKGTIRIRDTIQEIRAITGVDGIHLDNFDLLPILYTNWELTIEKNQVSNHAINFEVNHILWPNQFTDSIRILSQKYIYSRAIRTILNNSIHFAKKNISPKIQVEFRKIENNKEKITSILFRNNGPPINPGHEKDLFNLKSSKYFGTELIGLPFIKELLKSVHCNVNLTDNGRQSGWVEFQILMKDYK
jgi:signal transduction histidine kinase